MSQRTNIQSDEHSLEPIWPHAARPIRVLLLGNGHRANVQAEAERLQPLIEQHAEIVVSDFRQRVDLSGVSADFAVVLGEGVAPEVALGAVFR